MFSESFKPYLLDSLHRWCVDRSYTTHLMVMANYPGVENPHSEFAHGDRMILNLSSPCYQNIQIDSRGVRFDERSGGTLRKVEIPLAAVVGMYAAENRYGFSFDEPNLAKTRAKPQLRLV